MSSEAVNAVLDHSTIRDPYGRIIFVAIARFVGPKGEAGYPSIRTIAENAAVDKNTVTAWVAKIEEAGELSTRKEGKGRGTKIFYTVNLPFGSDNNQRMSESGSDNNHSDNNGGMSEQVRLLSEKIELLSEQVRLLSERMSDNVLPRVQTETGNRTETKETRERNHPPAPDNDRAILDFLDINNLPRPKSDEEWAAVRSDEALIWITVTGQWPGYEALGIMRGRMGENPSEEYLRRAWELWLLSGFKRNNISGVLDWYHCIDQNPQWKPSDRFSGNGRPPALPEQSIEQIFESMEI